MGYTAKCLFILFLAVQMAGVVGCKNKPETFSDTSEASPVPPTSIVSPPTASAAAPFQLKLYTKYDGRTYINQLTFAETGTDTCKATTTAPVAICTVTVPEGRLYFSSLNFNYSWLPTSCPLLTFQTYYYRASVSAAYIPPGATSSIDCTAIPISPTCFGGAAPALVAGFPTFVGLIHLPDEANLTVPSVTDLPVASAYSIAFGSNRRTVNDLAPAKVGNTYTSAQLGGLGDGYLPNTYVDYTFTCRDHWYDPATYTVHLNVRDENSAAGTAVPINDFQTWSAAP